MRKARWAGALFGGREPGGKQRSPEVHEPSLRKEVREEEREGFEEGGDDLFRGFAEGEPKRLKSPREQEVPT